MTTSASLCGEPIFYFYVLTFMQESNYSSLFLFIFSYCKHHVVRKDLGTYIQLDMSDRELLLDITLEENRLGGKIISPYLSMCLAKSFCSVYML